MQLDTQWPQTSWATPALGVESPEQEGRGQQQEGEEPVFSVAKARWGPQNRETAMDILRQSKDQVERPHPACSHHGMVLTASGCT